LCVHSEFERRVRRRPNAVAVGLGDQTLTYGELNACANGLAHRLTELGAGPEALIGLCVERSLELVIGIVGILKSGAAYVPLDPVLPMARLDYILADANVKTLVTTAVPANRFPGFGGNLLFLDGVRRTSSNPRPKARPENLAYVMYTSGSTGRPKGVMIEHRNVTSLFRATERHFSFSERDTWALFHSFGFDLSVWEIWGALAYGGRVEIVPRDVARSAPDFGRFLAERKITVLDQTPSAFTALIQVPDMDNRNGDLALRVVTLAGEALIPPKLKSWWRAYRGRRPAIVNMYGITETTIHATYHRLTEQDLVPPASVIGRPLPHLNIHLTEPEGEMIVSGAGVGRGYLGRPDLTQERFAKEADGTRTYRSGDLGKVRPDGALEYLGRQDRQVKIRGFRVELGEIEAVLAASPDVAQCAVLLRDSARLVAYIVPSLGSTVDPKALRILLEAELPDYMVPSAIVPLAALPLTANGKIDHAALREPDEAPPRSVTAPRTPAERSLAALWADLLRRDAVGVEDNFFDLGGDSLLAAKMAVRLSEQLGIQVSLARFYEHPVLADFARSLNVSADRTQIQ
jgi:amino acid adenylation domain-containing protein